MKKILLLFVLFIAGLTSVSNAQSITVTSPNGGEIWSSCTQRTITWNATATSGFYNVDYSTNGGASWASIATFLNATTLSWTLPNVSSTNCLVRVIDSYSNTVVDQSNATFTINAAVRVTSPNGGENWQVGNPATQPITWVASGTSSTVTIEYSTNAGSSWTVISSSVSATSGTYNWTVPNTPSTQCLIRVRDNVTSCMSDISDNLFTITAPTPQITVTAPNTAVTWYVGLTNTIQWTSQYVTNPFVGIDYSTDGGTTWNVIVASVNNTGSYSWTVPNAPTSQARIRVKDASNPTTFDISNINFTIAVQVSAITVTSPNGNEVWPSCTQRIIAWTATSTSGFYNVDYSTNGGVTWASIATFLSATSLNWTVPNVQSTNCLIRVYDSYNNTIVDQSNAVFTINAAVRVTSPNGGENWQVGNPAIQQITWVASGTSATVTLEYSIDAGNTWTVISTSVSATSGSYNWTLPNAPSSQCLVRVRDNNTPCMADVSDNLFTLIAPVPVITVTSPNTAVTWYVGYSNTIQWTSQYITNPFVAIDYSTDGGTTWTVVTSSTNNSGSYNWTVPNTPSSQARIRVKDAATPSTFDISNVNFTIAVPVPTITVITPNGGETWNSCQNYNITWSNTFVTGNYSIEYSVNNGGSWTTIVSSVAGSSYSWQVPNNIATSSQCLIRVSSVANPTVFDVSNATFTINQVQYVVVTSPNGGESWQVGNPVSRTINWVFSGTGNYFNIEYSTNNGVSWTTIVNGQYAASSPASYTWTLPNVSSSLCLIRVSDYSNICRSDVSDNTFTILAPTPVITVTSPNTATTWFVGSSYSINWTSQYVTNPFVGIDYSTDNGTTWNVISATTNNTGSYTWTVPNTPSTQCLVRVKDAANPNTTFDVSNVNFTIAVPVSSINVTSPNGAEIWNSCSNYSISWTSSNVTGNYRIEYSADGGSTWNTIISSVSGLSYSWLVPNNIPTSTQCLIRVSSVSNPAISDISNAVFTINQVQFIAINSPVGGEVWQVGNPTTRTINWAYSGTTTQFTIEYSINNGVSWNTIVNGQTFSSSPASYTWTIPNAPSTQCLVRVRDYNNSCRSDESDSVFTIQAPTPQLTVTSPNTAVTWYVGNTYNISWSQQYVTDPFVSLEYSIDSGATWINIISAVNLSLGTYSWTVPNTPTTAALVRVKSTANPTTIVDVSNVDFTIATPVQTITVNAPNGGETWNSCVNYVISWGNTFVTGNYRLEYSDDAGNSWNTIVSSVSGSSYSWQVPNDIATSGQCLIRVSSVSNPAVFDISNANFTINQVQYVVVTSPNGGENWQVGNPNTRTITWAYSGTTTQFTLEYSTDNGLSWNMIVNGQTFSSSPASYTWTIPNVPSTQCLVRVRDYNNSCRSDESNAVFTIQAPTPVITVTSPNTAVTWYVGNVNSINWSTIYVNDPFVAIDYSIDNGTTWSNIVSSINTSVGSYSWTVPNTPSTAALVRVKSTANPTTIFDVSNVNFTIAPPIQTITVTSPNGGENWNSCVNYVISWGNTFVTGNYRLEYSSDNGATWNTIISSVSGSSYSWQVPNNIATSSQCLIRVSSVSNPAVFDVSNANFTINQVQYVVVTSPNGGENWQVGNPNTRTITWAYSGTSTQFTLEYSTDNGLSWNMIVNGQTFSSSPASYTWTIPNVPSTQCLVRVRDFNNSCRSDESNAVFTIQAPTPVITVTSPNTATTWYVGNANPINWSTIYVNDPFVAIDYSIDNGTTWSNIISSINTSVGSYLWTVPNTPSTTALVRVRSTANPTTIFDVSNVNFTIAPPIQTITVTSPNGGENWNSCVNYVISWGNTFVTGNYKLEYSSDNGTTWNTIISSVSGSSYSWQVPNNIATSSQCLIRVSSVSNPTVVDVSNANFVINKVQYIVVTAPNGGEIWQVGNPNTRTITWAYSGTSTQFILEYSTDNGLSWTTIVNGQTFSSSPASYTWTIPNVPSAQCLVRVRDFNNSCRSDESNAVFTIQAPTPVITVTSPNTGVLWGVGGNYNITWTSQYVTAPFVGIDYSIDGGATWTNIVSAVNTTAGTYNWTVPNTLSSQCRVRVRDNTNPAINDISNVNFSIVPAITVTSPNGGENWGGCTVSSVTWTAYGTSGNFRIEYSLDNGQTWNTVVTSFAATGPNCTYSWTIPHANSSTCLVRVSDAAAPSKLDIGNSVFTMFPAIIVTSPTNNVAVFTGQTLNITWTSTGVSNYYNIDYSINGGSSWTSIVFNSLITTNTYAWTVPATLSTNCVVRVTDNLNTCKQDISDGTFAISSSTANVVITAPNGGENWVACSQQTIQWSAQGTSGVYNIEYSTNGGTSWFAVATSYSSPGPNCSYTWTVPNNLSSNCLIRVTDAANSSSTDQSNAVFTISAFSVAATSSSSSLCVGGSTTLTATGAALYTWMPGNLSGNIVSVTPGGTTTYTVTGTSGACSAVGTVSVTVLPLPTVTASSSSSTICQAGSVTLNATGASTYVWSPGGSLNISNIASPVASPVATTTYTVTGTNSNGCSNTSTVTVTVIAAGSIAVTASQNNICPGTPVTLTASGATTYDWQPGNGTGTTFSVTPTSTTTYTVTGTTGSCSSTSTITITVTTPPIVNVLASTTTVCAGNTVTLTASGASSYSWMPGNLTGTSVAVTPTASTTYTVIGSNGNCSDTAFIAITVNPSPTLVLSGTNVICAGSSTTLSATGATSYVWMPGNLNGNSVTVAPVATTTYTVTGTTGSCTTTQTITVTVNPQPTVTAGSNQSICSGSMATLAASGATTYNWMPGNLSGASVAVTPATTTTYTVTGTTTSGCSSTATTTITVVTPPTITLAGTTTICSGSSTTLTANGAVTYNWMPGNLTGASVTVSPLSTTTYTVVGTTGSCSTTQTITVTVHPLPVVTASASQSIVCIGGSTTLTASGAATYSWQPGNLSGASVTVSPVSATTYTVTGTSVNGCVSTSTVAVGVQAVPVVAVSGNAIICGGGSTTLTASGATSYSWTPGNFPGSSITVSPTAATTYTVTGTTGSCSSTQTFAVTVAPSPTVIATAAQPTICSGSTTSLTASGAASYTWMPGNLTGASVSVSPTTTTTYTVTGVNGSCTSTAIVTVTVNPAAPPTIVGNTSVCAGSGTVLVASGAVSYLWMPGSVNNDSLVISPVNTTTYTVTATSANGCVSTATTTVTVQPIPSIVASGPASVCSGSPATFTASGASTYVWQPGNFPGNSLTASPLTNTTYTVTGTTAGCSSTATVAVTVAATPTVAASATPASTCPGGAVTLTATGASVYTWMPGNLTGTSVSVTPMATTTYTVTGINGSCSSTATVTVTVNSVAAINITGAAAICAGNSTTLAATGAVTYNWMPGNLTGSSVTVTPSSTTTYTVTGTNAAGCTTTATFAVTVTTAPVVSISGPSAVCTGSPATLVASGATSYSWQPGNFTGSSITVAPTTTTTYTATGTTSGCSSTATFALTVSPVPVVAATAAPSSLCMGDSTTLTATGAAAYTWMPGSLSGNNIRVSPTTTTTYTVTGVNGSCSSTATVSVTVNSIATIGVNGTPSICQGSNTMLTATGAATYSWMPGNLSGNSVTVAPLTTTTYTVTGVNASGCTGTTTFVVTVTPAPVVTVTGPSSICAGSPATLTASGATSYIWQPGNFTGSSITDSPLSTTTYTVTGTTGGCSATATLVLNVSPSPVVTASAAQSSVCIGGSTTLTATGAAAYTWMPGNLSGSNISVSPTATTTYTVTGIIGSCSSTATVTVTVNSTLPLSASATQNTVCAGSATTLSASGASSYTWMPGNLSGSNISVSPTVTTTYTVTGVSGTCSGTQTVTITANPTPNVVIIGGGSVCAGSTAQLTATGASGYVWQPGNLSGSTVTVAPSSTTTYTVVGTGSSGCTDTTTVSLAVNPLPVISISGDGLICAGNSSQLTASGAVSYNWQPGNIAGNSISVSPTVNTTYTVTGIDAAGCSATATQLVAVTPAPVVLLSGNTQICSGNTTQLFATGASSYLWQPGNLADSSVTVSPVATTTYTVTGTSGNCSSTSTITVIVNPAPVVTASTQQASFCAGGSTLLTATGASNYIWMPGNLTGAVVAVSPSTTTTYTVTGTNGNCSSTATVLITVLPAPIVTVSQPATTLCQGASATLVASGATSYLWTPGNSTNDTIVVAPATTTAYQVTGIDVNGCSATATATVTIVSAPLVNAIAATNTICAGEAVTLTAAGADVYSWVPGNFGGATVSDAPATTTTYTVTGTNSNGCSSTDTVTVFVNPLPVVTLVLPVDTVCSGEAPFILTGGSPVGGTYSGQGVVAGQFDPMNSGAGLHQLTYTWIDPNTGCDNFATQLIYVDPCTGIDESINKPSFTMYPNPTDDRLTIVYSEWSEPVTVIMYNALGQEVSKLQLTDVQTEISLRDLPVGVYQLSLITPQGMTTQKVIKN